MIETLLPEPGPLKLSTLPGGREGTVWRIELPADSSQAVRGLELEAGRLRAMDAAVSRAPDRIDRVIEQAVRAEARPGVSYGVRGGGPSGEQSGTPLPPPGEGPPLPGGDRRDETSSLAPPDRALLEALRAGGSPGAQSFSIFGDSRAREAASLERRLTGLLEQLTHQAYVETVQRGALLARTAVHWGGSIDSIVSPSATSSDLGLHRRSVLLAVGTRNSWMRILSISSQMASRCAGALVSPLAAVSALPAVWQFMQQITTEARRLEAEPGAIP